MSLFTHHQPLCLLKSGVERNDKLWLRSVPAVNERGAIQGAHGQWVRLGRGSAKPAGKRASWLRVGEAAVASGQ